MNYQAESVNEYIALIPEERMAPFLHLRQVIKDNLPRGFEECLSYGFPTYAVPHSIYPAGYHCKPQEPLPFISLANQKNFIGFYHLGLYAQPEMADWFKKEYLALDIGKPDMGKSCLRLKKMDKIPFDLLAALCRKITPEQWIAVYEKELKN